MRFKIYSMITPFKSYWRMVKDQANEDLSKNDMLMAKYAYEHVVEEVSDLLNKERLANIEWKKLTKDQIYGMAYNHTVGRVFTLTNKEVKGRLEEHDKKGITNV